MSKEDNVSGVGMETARKDDLPAHPADIAAAQHEAEISAFFDEVQPEKPQAEMERISDSDLSSIFNACNFESMATADDLFYLIARGVEARVRTDATRLLAEKDARIAELERQLAQRSTSADPYGY